jgi:hypothetical protein
MAFELVSQTAASIESIQDGAAESEARSERDLGQEIANIKAL